tara:strand:- start:5846 stop:6295 length:450 start_codon:yes stop_codon:yes gene_type:complete
MSKIPVKDILAAIDMNAKSVWKELDTEQKKSVSFWLLNRYISSVAGSSEKQALAVLKTNEFFNKNYMVAYNHPELQWQLLCISGNTKNIEFHKYQGLKSNVTNTTNKFEKILIKLFPDKKLDDIKVLASISTKEEIEQLIEDHALDIKI